MPRERVYTKKRRRGLTESSVGTPRPPVYGDTAPATYNPNNSDRGADDVQTDNPTLLVILGLASWADTGFAASIQRAARPVIASTTVDAERIPLNLSWSSGGLRGTALGSKAENPMSHQPN
jgi:hypothetical protein